MKYNSLENLNYIVTKETEKAVQIRIDQDPLVFIWIPKSIFKIAEVNNDYIMFVPSWYYMKNIQTLLNSKYNKFNQAHELEYIEKELGVKLKNHNEF